MPQATQTKRRDVDAVSIVRLWKSAVRSVFRHGNIHRPAVEPNGVDLIAAGRDELPRHPRQLAGLDVEGLADALQQAAGGFFRAIHTHALLAP